jgi:hypothetical protein
VAGQRVDYAGFQRSVLERNAPRYDSEGDELDEDDDEAADADTAEENPYSQVILQSEFVHLAGDYLSAFENFERRTDLACFQRFQTFSLL